MSFRSLASSLQSPLAFSALYLLWIFLEWIGTVIAATGSMTKMPQTPHFIINLQTSHKLIMSMLTAAHIMNTIWKNAILITGDWTL